MTMRLRHVPRTKLFVSEPNPAWFGNPPNEKHNPNWDVAKSQNWLKSRFHFSFAEYNNYQNSNFGVLRVMNDDFVQPSRGFGTHGHSNMEIITYIVEGKLTHEDSLGTEGKAVGRGGVQFMTAGRGVRHSEFNLEEDRGLRFIQTWIVPRRNGLMPNYGSFDPEEEEEDAAKKNEDVCTVRNQWRHLVSDVQDDSSDTPVQIEQDANVYAAEIDPGQSLDLQIKGDRMAYVLCVEGSIKLDDGNGKEVTLQRHDGCEIIPSPPDDGSSAVGGAAVGGGGGEVKFEAVGSEKVEDGTVIGGHALVFEMAHVAGAGRGDVKDA